MKKYRIVVEKRPGESFSRYYPEIYRSTSMTDDCLWMNTQMPIEIRWYKDIEDCVSHINKLKEFDRIRNKEYVVDIIEM